MVKIIIADDHAVIREGLRSMLNNIEGWQVIAEAGDGLELISLVENHKPDLVILDLAMPNLGGVEALARLQKLEKAPLVLVLSARDDEAAAGEAIEAGAKGYVPKSADNDELQFAVRAVIKGQTYISPTVCEGVLSRSQSGQRAFSPLSSLTSREREVMKLLSEGRPNREVAKVLHVSPRTIDSHRANIMKKLGITSNAELVQLAIKYGLIE